MKDLKKKLFPIFLAFSLMLLLAACGSKSSSSSSSSINKNGDLKIGLTSNIASLDPIKYTSTYESNVMRQIFDTLVNYNSKLTKIEPSLAKKWTISKDMTTYTFYLRNDVHFQKGKFQNGRKMTAEDVKYSLMRSMNDSAMHRIRYIKSIDVLSSTKVVIHLTRPYSGFLAMLTDVGNSIVPKEEVEGWGKKFGQHPVGTGPYTFKKWSADNYVKLDRNNKYWAAKPKLKSVTFSFITDSNTMGNSLQSGNIDIATSVSGENIPLINKNKKLVLKRSKGLSIGYIAFNMKSGPTKNLKVRQAMEYALNRKQLVNGVYKYNEAKPAYLPLPRASWGYSKQVANTVPKYNLKKAKELLKEAGYPHGFKIKLYVTSLRESAATIFQAQMKKVGINVEINTVEWGTFSNIVSAGKAPLYMMGWSWYPDPDFFLYQMFSSDQIGALGNGGGYSNSEVDSLLNKASSVSTNEKTRAKIYKQALKKIVADVPHLDLYDQEMIDGLNKNVKDFQVRADGSIVLVDKHTNVWLAK